MTRQSSKFVALLALVMVISACGGSSPTAPKVELCLDQNAQNYNQPAPCVPKPAPTVSDITFKDSHPKPGSELEVTVLTEGTQGNPVSGDVVEVTLTYTVSPEHLALANSRGWRIVVKAALSADGVTMIQGGSLVSFWTPLGQISGESRHKFSVVAVRSPGVDKTSHILARLDMAPADAPNQAEILMPAKPIPVAYRWVKKKSGS